MAAADVEVVSLAIMRVDATGTVFFGDTTNRTIAQNIVYSSELRVIADPAVPESANNPDVRTYLKLMATRGSPHVPVAVLQTMIVTRKSGT